jgi:putative transposase
MRFSLHHPPHLFIDDSWYFITARTVDGQPFIRKDHHKNLWLKTIAALSAKMNIKLTAWVVLDNHYHMLVFLNDALQLPNLIRRLHGSISYQINKYDQSPGRQIWYNYWDRTIRNEEELWTKFNYIHYNPVKHGYVKDPGDWVFSTYRSYLQSKGQEWMADCFQCYPVIDFNFEN